jgi:hypothetical protein
VFGRAGLADQLWLAMLDLCRGAGVFQVHLALMGRIVGSVSRRPNQPTPARW